MNEPGAFGVWLREAREAAGISQAELAHRSSITPIQISNIERGKTRNPKPKTRALLGQALESTPPAAVDPSEPKRSPSEFGVWMGETRLEAGMTQAELAQRSGVSLPQIWNIEQGMTQTPRPATRQRLESALGDSAKKEPLPEDDHPELQAWRNFRDAIVQAERETATGFEFLRRFGAVCADFANEHGLINDITARKIYGLTRD